MERRGERRMGTATAVSALLALAPLASCGQSDGDPGPGGVTVGEARALDEAAEMLDARYPPEGTPPEATGEEAAAAE